MFKTNKGAAAKYFAKMVLCCLGYLEVAGKWLRWAGVWPTISDHFISFFRGKYNTTMYM